MIYSFALLWSLLHFGVLLLPKEYISEIIGSFLPYSIVWTIIIFFLLLILLIKKHKKRLSYSIVIISIVSLSILAYLDIKSYMSIYHTNIPNLSDTTTGQNITFLYGNIYYKNNNFTWLLETIKSTKPDIILFVEYAKIHNDILNDIIKEEYPYYNRYAWHKHFDGDIIFSRYPLVKIDQQIVPGTWSFSHVTIKKEKKELDIALVHTSAPVSPSFFVMREEQMDKLFEMLQDYYTTKTQRNIMIIGDFNIAPRSPWYKEFNKNVWSWLGLNDISADLEKTIYHWLFPYTRCHQYLPFVCSHIDHVRSNNNTLNLSRISIPWSDHYGFIGNITL